MTNLSPNEFTHEAGRKSELGKNGWERLMLHAFHLRWHPSWNDLGRKNIRSKCREYLKLVKQYKNQQAI